MTRASVWFSFLTFILIGCSSTEIIESPKTGFASQVGEAPTPELVWTTRTLAKGYDYLGQLKVRSWTYDGALERLVDGGKQMHADAIVDIHYEKIGFLNQMQAFAVKYKN